MQSYIHWLRGDSERTIKSASQALINLDSEDTLNRGVTLISLATALEGGGLHTEALEAYTEAIETCCHGDCTHIYILAIFCKSQVNAHTWANCSKPISWLQLPLKKCWINIPVRQIVIAALGNLYANRAEVFLFRNNLASALEMANEGVRLGQQWRQADTTITTRGIKSAVLWTMGQKRRGFQNTG